MTDILRKGSKKKSRCNFLFSVPRRTTVYTGQWRFWQKIGAFRVHHSLRMREMSMPSPNARTKNEGWRNNAGKSGRCASIVLLQEEEDRRPFLVKRHWTGNKWLELYSLLTPLRSQFYCRWEEERERERQTKTRAFARYWNMNALFMSI